MLPEVLLKLPFDRLVFAPGVMLPCFDDGEPCIYIVVEGCVTLEDLTHTAHTVFWPDGVFTSLR